MRGGFRAPVSARYFSNFPVGGAETGSTSNRDRLHLCATTKDKAQPSCPRSKTGELHRIVDSVRLNLREAEGPSTEMPQARRGSKIDWTSAAKDALLWVPARWTWPPGETLRARLAMCGALGRASVNSGAANQRSPNDVDPFPSRSPITLRAPHQIGRAHV